jgi:polar amino acid transport system permease protein
MSIALDFSFLLQGEYPQMIANGVGVMLKLTVWSWLLAMAIGIALATVRLGDTRLGNALVSAYVEWHQNVPVLVHVFIWYFGVPAMLPEAWRNWINANDSEFLSASIAVGLVMAAYIAEALRGGIRSIPRSQLEASRALGLSYLQSARLVVLPQALRIALPPLVSATVLLFKNTSLAMAVGAAELTYVTREIESATFRTFEVYLLATVVYLGISLLIMAAGKWLEQRYRIKER